jgi:hypothetical protein
MDLWMKVRLTLGSTPEGMILRMPRAVVCLLEILGPAGPAWGRSY